MGDMAKGIKSFKKNMSDEDNASVSNLIKTLQIRISNALGWMEISIILIITIVVVGPKEIPTVIRFIKGMTSALEKCLKNLLQQLMN